MVFARILRDLYVRTCGNRIDIIILHSCALKSKKIQFREILYFLIGENIKQIQIVNSL